MKQGFTLIELLVVVLIIGILSAVALPQYQTAIERSRATEALTQLNAIGTSMQRYHSQHNNWPGTFSKLDVDIPCRDSGCSKHGGKFFEISLNGGVITAARTTGEYTITATISESNDAYTISRTCSGTSGDGEDYCNAITGGNNTGF